jgi:uncharacterized membrane protein YoaK (UPF0700 family)
MKITLPVLLSLNAGYLDAAGYLALHGLFTAHVTGNFVTLGASIVHGAGDAVPKLLALPEFCIVVIVTRAIAHTCLRPRGVNVLRTMLALEVVLLLVGATLAIGLGPFSDGDRWSITLTGMVLVAAMAIQNAAHRIHFASEPPTTLMTGTTTQIMIDVADLRGLTPDQAAQTEARLARMSKSVVAFTIGCGAGALLYGCVGEWCFAVPPAVTVFAPFLPVPPVPTSKP